MKTNKSLKRIFSILLALCMVVQFIPLNHVHATEVDPQADTVTIYFNNTGNWGQVYAYYWSDTNTGMTDWPGVAMTDGGNGIWSVTVPADATMIIFNDGGGSQTPDLTIPTDGKNQYNYGDNSWTVYGAADESCDHTDDKLSYAVNTINGCSHDIICACGGYSATIAHTDADSNNECDACGAALVAKVKGSFSTWISGSLPEDSEEGMQGGNVTGIRYYTDLRQALTEYFEELTVLTDVTLPAERDAYVAPSNGRYMAEAENRPVKAVIDLGGHTVTVETIMDFMVANNDPVTKVILKNGTLKVNLAMYIREGVTLTNEATIRLGENAGITNEGTAICLADGSNHTWKNGTCQLCGAVCAHTGGEATCMHGKLCEVCGYEYDTTTDPDNHASENYTYTDNGDGTHTGTYSCCNATVTEDHTFDSTDGQCQFCEADMAAAKVTASAGATTYYLTLGEAVTEASKGTADAQATLTLLKDINLDAEQVIESGVFTFDLNGFDIAYSQTSLYALEIYNAGTNVTLISSQEGGRVISNGGAIWTDLSTQLTATGIYVTANTTGFFLNGSAALSHVTVYASEDGVSAYESPTLTVTDCAISGEEIALFVNSGVTVDVTGGSITGGFVDIYADGSVTVAGTTFPGGISTDQKVLNEILAQGAAYWAGDTMLTVADNVLSILDKGDITVKPECTHENGNALDYINNGDGTHDATCSDCGIAIIEDHEIDTTTGKCVCDHQMAFKVDRVWDSDGDYISDSAFFDVLADALDYSKYARTGYATYPVVSAELTLLKDLTIAEGESFTFREHVVLKTNGFAVTNNGTLALEGYSYSTIPAAITGGTVKIGEASYTWSGEKWVCDEGSHISELEENKATCTTLAVCDICGESYGEVDLTNHDTENAAYENGFCVACDAYESAVLNAKGVYEIGNAGNLYWFADKVTNENATYGSANAILTDNIVVNEGTMTESSTDVRVWTPIGKKEWVGNQMVQYPYTGTFDGNGKTVSGLYFNDTSVILAVGLFSLVGEGGKVQNVGVVNSYLCGILHISGVVGENYGTVTDCYNTGTVISSGGTVTIGNYVFSSITVGGVVGQNYGTVTDCYNTGTVSGDSDVGGVAGSNDGTVTGCYNTGTVSGTTNVGGVVGSNSGTVTGCYNTGTVSGNGYVGGVVGYNSGTVTDCHNTGTISGDRNVGGVAGENLSGTVTDCYNSGTVSGDSYVGGVVGYNFGPIPAWLGQYNSATVTGCYNSGAVSGTTDVGGVVGRTLNIGTVTNCYSAGTVSGTTNVGGVAGYIREYATFVNCYYDSTKYTGEAIGLNEGTATDVAGKSTEAFKAGEVAWLLGQGCTIAEGDTAGTYPGDIWGQTIGTETYPVLGGQKVYKGYTSCHDDETGYTNDANASPEKPGHSFGEYTWDDNQHSSTCGLCGKIETDGHNYGTGHVCDCGKAETFTVTVVDNNDKIVVSLSSDTATFGEDFVAEVSSDAAKEPHYEIYYTVNGEDFEDAVYENGQLTILAANITGDIEIYVYPYVTVTFHGNGGVFQDPASGEEDETLVHQRDYGEERRLFTEWDEVREGHSFVNMNTKADGTGTPYETHTVYTYTEDLVLYAQWEANTYYYRVWTYTMNAYGNYGEPVTEVKSALYGTSVNAAPTSVAEGFYLDTENENSLLTATIPANNDLVLKVYIGRSQYSITWDLAGGTVENLEYLPKQELYDVTIAIPTQIRKEGHTLSHFVDQTGKEYEIHRSSMEDIMDIYLVAMPAYDATFTAVWTVNAYTLQVQDQSLDVDYGTNLTDVLADITPEKTGYTFTGWSYYYLDEDGAEQPYTGTTMPAYEIYAQPQFEAIQYNITWILNGCTVNTEIGRELPETLPYTGNTDMHQLKVVLDDPAGYTLTGFKDGDGNELSYDLANGYLLLPVTGDMTIEAVIEPKTYMATWESADGGSHEKEFEYGQTITIPTSDIFQETFRKAGYTLVGWEGYTEGMTMPIGGVTFKAKWQINPASLDVTSTPYTGQPHAPTVTVEGLTEGEDFTVEYPEDMVNVGEKIITVTGLLGGTTTVTYTIEKADATVTAPAANTLTYSGEAQALVTAGSVSGGTMHYSLDSATWSTAIPTGMNVGTYTVFYKVVGGTNYNDVEAERVEVTIKAKPIGEDDVALSGSLTYNGSEQTQNVAVAEGITFTVTGNKATGAGTYELTVTGTGNYTGTVTKEWTIAKAAQSITVQENLELSCTENGQLTAQAEGAITYASSDAAIVTVDVSGKLTAKKAGSTVITVSAAETQNYLAAQKTVTVTVGHDYETVVTAPTCEDKGYTTYTCACGDEYVADYVDAKDHDYKAQVTKAATCTEKGIKIFTCANDAAHTYTEEIPATGHTPKAAVEENREEATCTEAGSYEMATYCDVCGEELSRTQHTIDAIGHDYNDGVITTQPDCENEGVKTFTCANDAAHTYTEKVPAKGHSHTAVVTAPTCEAKGYTTYTCACGDEYVADYVDAKGHDYDDGVITTQPGCESEGVKTFTCANDATHTYTEKVSATGHAPNAAVEENRVNATCTEAGNYEMVVYCGTCHKELSRTEHTINAIGHDYDDGVITTQPGCESEGVKTFTCANDATHTYTEKVSATGHAPKAAVEENRVNATCTAKGSYEMVVYCGTCHKELSRSQHEIPVKGHSPKAPVEENRVEAACTEAGSYQLAIYCENCDEELGRIDYTISATGHSFGDWTLVKAATCTGKGQERRDCQNCDHYETRLTAALGHEYTDPMDPSCEVCGERREVYVQSIPMLRLYNPATGEHHYTGSAEERDTLVLLGWNYEGVAWNAPVVYGDPVYRMYDPNSGDHHYTMSTIECENLIAEGWNYEGVAWNSASPEHLPIYRLYNPNATIGTHHYTGSETERDNLVEEGWNYEGIAWYALKY